MTQPAIEGRNALRITKLNELLGRFLIPKSDHSLELTRPLGMLPLVTQYIDFNGAGSVFELAIKQKELHVLACLLASNEPTVDLGEGYSHSLSQFDVILGKPAGYACRSLLSAMAGVDSCESPIALRSISQAIAQHMEQGLSSPILRNGFTQFSKKLVSEPQDSFQMALFSSLYGALKAQGENPCLNDLHKALFECVLEEDFEDSRPAYDLILSLAKSVSGSEQSLHKALSSLMSASNPSDEAVLHIVDLLLSQDEAFKTLQNGAIKTFNPDCDRSDQVMQALHIALTHLEVTDRDLADRLNKLDPTVLSKGIKTRSDFETICKVVAFDQERLDKNALSYEARGGYFTQELGV